MARWKQVAPLGANVPALRVQSDDGREGWVMIAPGSVRVATTHRMRPPVYSMASFGDSETRTADQQATIQVVDYTPQLVDVFN